MGASGVGKSQYIDAVDSAANKVSNTLQMIRRSGGLDFNVPSQVTMSDSSLYPSKLKKKNDSANDNACRSVSKPLKPEQVFTHAALMIALGERSLLLISHEGESCMKEIEFFNFTNTKGDGPHGTMIQGFDGFKDYSKETKNYNVAIENKIITVLVASTGKKWNELLQYYNSNTAAGGFYERFMVVVVDDAVRRERFQALESLEDMNTSLMEKFLAEGVVKRADEKQFSIAQLFMVRYCLGFRYYKKSMEAYILLGQISE
ncbi:unnamed protein product [Didymodactylos carnosus]|uniref:Uncharacterized protein n=1 Tax=Didymodactylos carnosus TaxID=1234261 RepID=A0A814XWI6_9BILA|nr:unnamed protein product [Didymodactylos carnosus]CAF1221426.1 unnamed protein product [Didymodactylos carnosus]CAF3703398.1 unnamed protein product [Didymodactylos carnosus]CAF3984703.1 unnamed protein product [Didymodactylos carnosus]